MSLIQSALALGERVPWPDSLARSVIQMLVEQTRRQLEATGAHSERAFAETMQNYPIATNVAAANAQHYELPPEFFSLVLGPNRKYSCCLYADAHSTLAQAEDAALRETARHADLKDGQSILELGCGWGSLSLFMARQFPNAQITAVSNASAQRRFNERNAEAAGLSNLRFITADMNDFAPERTFDRVVSVEMFEHMANWAALLERIRGWLHPQGRLFLHVFAHRSTSYRFEAENPADWIGQYFFTGGLMPSETLLHHFDTVFEIEETWRWSGSHYRRTAEHWLINFDRHQHAIAAIFESVYGNSAALWMRRWRLFFLAVAGLFGHRNGSEWGVGHFRLRPVSSRSG